MIQSELNEPDSIIKSKQNKNDSNNEVENILYEIGGSFSKFQIFNYCIYAIVILNCAIVSMTFVFTTLNLDYR